MKIRLPLMVQDPAIARHSLKEGQRVTESFACTRRSKSSLAMTRSSMGQCPGAWPAG